MKLGYIVFIAIILVAASITGRRVVVAGVGAGVICADYIARRQGLYGCGADHTHSGADHMYSGGLDIGRLRKGITSAATSAMTNETLKYVFIQALMQAKQAAVTGASLAAAAGTLGNGGDILVEMLVLSFDAAEMSYKLAKSIIGLEPILSVTFKDGPTGVKEQVDIIRARDPTVANLRPVVIGCLGKVAEIFGRVLSCLIPNNANLISWVVYDVIIGSANLAAGQAFQLASNIYRYILPKVAREYATNPAELRADLQTVLEYLKLRLLNNSNDTILDRIGKATGRQFISSASGATISALFPLAGVTIGTGATLVNILLSLGIGTDRLVKYIDTVIMGSINTLAKLVETVMPLLYSMLYLLSL